MVIFTVATKNFLARTRVLMNSVAEHEPSARRVCVLADRVDSCFDPAKENFEVYEAESLGIPGFRNMAFRYTPMELCCALKPMVARTLFDKLDCVRIAHLDSDMRVYGPLSEVRDLLEDHCVVLSPHAITPSGGTTLHNQGLRHSVPGTYNAGFWALSLTTSVRRLLDWWSQCVATRCHRCDDKGLYFDQRWLELVPGAFTGVAMLRHPGYNVAQYNRDERPVELGPSGSYLAAGHPLILFHATKLFESVPQGLRLSKIASRWCAEQPVAGNIAEQYRAEVLNAGETSARSWPYSYASFTEGLPIYPCFRKRFSWTMDPDGQWNSNPFQALAQPSVLDSCPPFPTHRKTARRRGGRRFLAILWAIRMLLRLNRNRCPSRLVSRLYRWLGARAEAAYVSWHGTWS
jgi:hypothetical protein